MVSAIFTKTQNFGYKQPSAYFEKCGFYWWRHPSR